jgi:hypothetical protein
MLLLTLMQFTFWVRPTVVVLLLVSSRVKRVVITG